MLSYNYNTTTQVKSTQVHGPVKLFVLDSGLKHSSICRRWTSPRERNCATCFGARTIKKLPYSSSCHPLSNSTIWYAIVFLNSMNIVRHNKFSNNSYEMLLGLQELHIRLWRLRSQESWNHFHNGNSSACALITWSKASEMKSLSSPTIWNHWITNKTN